MLFLLAVKLTAIGVLLLSLSSASALVWGRARPINPALAGFGIGCDDQPQLCWYGIVPGVTDAEAAKEALHRVGVSILRMGVSYPSFTYFYSVRDKLPGLCSVSLRISNGIVTALGLVYCEETTMQIGEAAALLGLPHRVSSRPPHYVGYGFMTFNPYSWWSLHDSLGRIGLSAPLEPRSLYAWHGFVRKWRYCQLEPTYRGCQ